MSEQIQIATPSVADLLTRPDTGEYIPAVNRLTIVWHGSKSAKQDAIDQGITVTKDKMYPGINRAGSTDFTGFDPLRFYLVDSKEVYTKQNAQGEVISSKFVPPEKDDSYKQGFVVLGVAVRGEQLVPFVAGLGRLKGATGRFIQQARSAQSQYAGDIGARGPAFKAAAEVKAISFRCQFTATGRMETGGNGDYLPTKSSHRPVNQADIDICELNDILNPKSPFFRDMIECSREYQRELSKVGK